MTAPRYCIFLIPVSEELTVHRPQVAVMMAVQVAGHSNYLRWTRSPDWAASLTRTARATGWLHAARCSRRNRDLPLAFPQGHHYNYIMRSTRHVVSPVIDAALSHYSDPPLLVLASLAGGPKHGHAMIEDIAGLCGSRLGPGTLYGAIARLEARGLIKPLPPEERRRPYQITAAGTRMLRAQLSTLRQVVDAGTRRLRFV